MCCHFWGIPSTWWGIEGVLIYRNFSAPLFVPLCTLPRCQSDLVAVKRSLGRARVFCNRAIGGRCGTPGGCSMMVAIGADTPLGKLLWWPWRVCSISDWILWLDGGTLGFSLQATPDLRCGIALGLFHFLLLPHWWPWWLNPYFPSVFWCAVLPDHYLRVVMLQGWVGVYIPRGCDWAIIQWWHFFDCCALPRLGPAISSNLLGLQMWQSGGIVLPIDSSFLRGHLFADGMPLRCSSSFLALSWGPFQIVRWILGLCPRLP